MLSLSCSRLLTSLILALSISQHTHAANHDVQVGQSGLSYTPDHLDNVAAQDSITFHFVSQIPHSVIQSSLESPCSPLSGGFDSGVLTSAGTNSYQLTVNDTNPIWIYCDVTDHCATGMVFAVNANASALAQFQSVARGHSPSSSPPQSSSAPAGGSSSTTTAGGPSSTGKAFLTKSIADGVGIAALAAVVGTIIL